jgi:hypothetical protein
MIARTGGGSNLSVGTWSAEVQRRHDMKIRTTSALTVSLLLAATPSVLADPMSVEATVNTAGKVPIHHVHHPKRNSAAARDGSAVGTMGTGEGGTYAWPYGSYAYDAPGDQVAYGVPFGAFLGVPQHPADKYAGRSIGYRGWHGSRFYNGQFYR